MAENNRFIANLKSAKLDSLLIKIADMARCMFDSDKAYLDIKARRMGRLVPVVGNIIVTAWGLADIAYQAICNTSDFAPIEPDDSFLISLYNEYIGWEEEMSKEQFNDVKNDEDLTLKFTFGHSQKQFWYQEKHRIREEFNRQVELLEVIPKRINCPLDFDADCARATGFNMRELRTLLYGIYAIGGSKNDLSDFTFESSVTRIHEALTVENVRKVINLYSCDYSDIRNSKLLENYLFLKPIIKTTSQKIVNVSEYLLARKVADGPFWVLRDLYLREVSSAFVNEYGRLFEQYVANLLQYYIPTDRYERITERQDMRLADWTILTDKYRYIVEQKTAIATISLKTQYPSVEAIRLHLIRMADGIVQLDSTERLYSDKRITIKLLLHYETFHFTDATLRPIAVKAVADKISSTERIHFINIGEFEWFIGLIGTNSPIADKVMDLKIDTERDSPGSGIEFEQIIPKVTDIRNEYIFNKIDHWSNYIGIT